MSTDPDLDSFLSGHRLAFMGVSISAHCATRDLFRGLIARGHDVVPIRPGVSEIEGAKAYASVRSAGKLDGVVIMTSRRNAERALEECQLAGVRRVWLVGDDSSGDARAYAARHSIELVVLRDPLAALDHARGHKYVLGEVLGRPDDPQAICDRKIMTSTATRKAGHRHCSHVLQRPCCSTR